MNFIRKITNADIIEDLQHELMKERKAYQVMHNDFKTADLEAETYKFRASELGKELIELQEVHKDVAGKLDIQTSYNERLAKENATLSQELFNMRTDFENHVRDAKEECNRLTKILAEKDLKLRSLEAENKSLNAELEYRITRTKQLEKSIERLNIENQLKKETLAEIEKERVNLRKWNQQAKEELDQLQERIAFYEEVEDGNVHHYQSIIAKQNEQIKNLRRGMKK